MRKFFVFFIFYIFLTSFVLNKDDKLFFGVTLDTFPITDNKLISLQKEIGIKPKMINFFLMWTNHSSNFNLDILSSLKAIDDFDAIPCITWEPMYLQGNAEKVILKQDILNGKYDKYLSEFISQIKLFKKSVIIRFAQGMNLERYHWGTETEHFNHKSLDVYKKMFIYVVDFFRKNDVDNAFFAFCPNVDSVPLNSWNTIKNYYPGNEYVDILGLDGYNFGKCANPDKLGFNSSWKNFEDIFKAAILELKELSPIKPLIIFEIASTSKGGDKTLWVKDAIETSHKLDVTFINWFQVSKECDWKITNDQVSILKKYFSEDDNKIIQIDEIIR